jgi:hypothetical protein
MDLRGYHCRPHRRPRGPARESIRPGVREAEPALDQSVPQGRGVTTAGLEGPGSVQRPSIVARGPQ